MSLHVSETFHSIQGEGSLAGMPSTFIRLAHCNLSCSWCDAAYTWRGDVKFEPRSIADVCDQVRHRHVVITGGEPTYADAFASLCAELDRDGKHITVETNGTIWRADAMPHVHLWSVSPKLGSSGQAPMLDEGVLREYLRLTSSRVQWKFVISNEDDFNAALLLMRRLGMGDGDQVFMQPNGLCHIFQVDEIKTHSRLTSDTSVADGFGTIERDVEGVRVEAPYLARVRWLYELVVAADAAGDLPCPVRAVPQSHKLAWGNRRGY